MTRRLRVTAPAKLNLFLHVTGRRTDGYHELDSLVTFLDLADHITLEPWREDRLAVAGPFAAGVPRGDDNLIWRAIAALRAAGVDVPPLAITLDKQMPAEAGLGGGSADAAAVLAALASLPEHDVRHDGLLRLAAGLGADLPACLTCRDVRIAGIGERMTRVHDLPRLPVVLVVPPVGCATGAIFQGLGGRHGAPAPPLPAGTDITGLSIWLAGATANALQEPAIAHAPEVGEVLAMLAPHPACLLARMTGSGSACFAVCADLASRERLAESLRRARPDWHVLTAMSGAGRTIEARP